MTLSNFEAFTPPEFLPTDLYSDEPPLESERHLRQIILLLSALERLWSDRQDFYAAGNMTVYYNAKQLKSREFRGPDFFVVLNTERKERKSWVVWGEEGKYPDLIIEILSDSTAEVDRGEKKQLYQNVWRTPEYFWFDPESLEFQGFRLVEGQYEPIAANEQGWLWSKTLQLYLGINEERLRFFTPQGELVPTPSEAELQARQQAEEARQQLEQERQRAEQYRQQLRDLGIEPE